ncbi:major facilitator superfamily domain-containing protein 3-like isoform X1 [Acanthaster planci]|uniref:Major facilitator superfamily domain-containing protein 3-like isoform X1 n=1 Tax=Acanthaster planci TaxID=133434 RepID=A0A8B7Z4E9_ACAPL|nr:major facilitator superfamily domain-containing protein 3-like isoform X1 [Acanthaster planci]XP_022100500.1 major facilitator superfamily domain-containing protein 3-like isoform X1 [Acanthaster planci]XP_022100508.1 major facilitator superfamily domain-containing protein 3-like isoform X1 [Acanthaster planci]
MAGSDAVRSKILCLLLLYFVQGIPYGFQARFLPIFLRSRGTSLTSLGFFKILLLPWMLKVLWAPFLERYASRQTNLLYSLVAMATVCGFTSCISPDQTVALCVAILLLNLSASIQDIAVDAIAIHILTESELGAGNTVQVVGYKVGSIIGGGLLIWLLPHTEWSGLFVLLAALYTMTLIIVMHLHVGDLRECKTDKESDVSNCNSVQSNTDKEPVTRMDSKIQLVSSLITDVVNSPHTKWMMAFALFYKLGEQGAVGMFPLYLIDHGIPVGEVGILSGVISQGLSIAGSLAGGWMLSNPKLSLKPLHLLPYLMKLRLLPLILQTAVISCNYSDTSVPFYENNEGIIFKRQNYEKGTPDMNTETMALILQIKLYKVLRSFSSEGPCVLAMWLLQLIGGAITIATFTLMMQCSQNAPLCIQATHYTALATLEVMGKLTFMSVAGWLVDMLGYTSMFCLFITLSVGMLAMFRP